MGKSVVLCMVVGGSYYVKTRKVYREWSGMRVQEPSIVVLGADGALSGCGSGWSFEVFCDRAGMVAKGGDQECPNV